MSPGLIVDAHAHVLTLDTVSKMGRECSRCAPKLSMHSRENGDATLQVGEIVQSPFPKAAWDLELRFRDLERYGIDRQILSSIPHLLLYEEDPSVTEAFSIIQNDAIAELVEAHPDRFYAGLATVPLQDAERAARELDRAMEQRSLKGAMIGSNVAGRNLDDPALEPFWETAAARQAFILVHPHKIAAGERLKSYYLKNLIGNPLETTIAAASLIFGGVTARYPSIRFYLSHGGGFLPYHASRLIHGWHVRPEPKKHLEASPEEAIARMFHDTITHSRDSLTFLVEKSGASNVVFGTDYPFDMGWHDHSRVISQLQIADGAQQQILGGNIEQLLGSSQR